MLEVRAKTYMLAEVIRIMALYGATIGNLLKGIDNKTVKVHIFEMATKIDKIFTVNLTFTT